MHPIDMMVTDYNCEYLGLSRLCLMESAGKSLAEEVGKIAVYTFAKPVKVAIFTGSGGNGGDGFVAARYLLNRGYDVDIYMLKDNIRSPYSKTNLEILQNMKPRLSRLNIFNLKTLEDIDSCEIAQNVDSEYVIVDGLLGTGIKGNLQTNIKRAIEIINESKGIVISVDVPSGMDPLTGEVNDLAVVPDYTISFHKIKTGVRDADEELVGGLVTADIGIPFEAEYFVNYGDFLRLKNRHSSSHKGNNGRLLVIGGSKDYSGAPAIAGMAAIGAGADLVYVASPQNAAEAIKSTSPDLIVKSLEGDKLSLKHSDEILSLVDNVDSVLIGPGAGIDDDTFAKIIACIRISVPYTGMIVSTRESQKSRERVLHLGVSQISGGSKTSVGGYAEPCDDEPTAVAVPNNPLVDATLHPAPPSSCVAPVP